MSVRHDRRSPAAPLVACLMLLLLSTAPYAVPAAARAGAGESADALPGDSLYQLPLRLETQQGKMLSLSQFRGRPLLITMFYSQCTAVCPVLTSALQRLDRRLNPADRSKLGILMVSLDSQNDTPAVLRAFAQEHHIDDARWVLARTTEPDVRVLAATLGISYRKLPDGSFNHSSVIALLDSAGVMARKSTDLVRIDEAFLTDTVAAIRTRSAK